MTSRSLQEIRIFKATSLVASNDPTKEDGEDDAVNTDIDAAEGRPKGDSLHPQVQHTLAKMEERSKCWRGGCLIG